MQNDLTNTGVVDPPGGTRETPSAREARRAANRNGHKTPREGDTREAVQGPPKSVFREYFESAVVTVIMALFGMTFIVQAVKVPTGSMQNTILIGDHLLVNKFIFAPGPALSFLPQREIRRGDIIVFKYPGNKYEPDKDRDRDITAYKTNYVKRVVGLPGDRLELRNQRVIINGQPLPERHVVAEEKVRDAPLEIVQDAPRRADETYTAYYKSPPEDDREVYPIFLEEGDGRELTIPDGSYFVMGDNRDNSEDSRYWGFVPRELVIGRAMFVYWSYDESAPADGNPLSLFFRNSRWGRTGTMVK